MKKKRLDIEYPQNAPEPLFSFGQLVQVGDDLEDSMVGKIKGMILQGQFNEPPKLFWQYLIENNESETIEIREDSLYQVFACPGCEEETFIVHPMVQPDTGYCSSCDKTFVIKAGPVMRITHECATCHYRCKPEADRVDSLDCAHCTRCTDGLLEPLELAERVKLFELHGADCPAFIDGSAICSHQLGLSENQLEAVRLFDKFANLSHDELLTAHGKLEAAFNEGQQEVHGELSFIAGMLVGVSDECQRGDCQNCGDCSHSCHDSEPDEPGQQTWFKYEIWNSPELRAYAVNASTNDDNDDGYPDNEVERWTSGEFKSLREAIAHCGGVSRIGAYGQPIDVYLDGVKLTEVPKEAFCGKGAPGAGWLCMHYWGHSGACDFSRNPCADIPRNQK